MDVSTVEITQRPVPGSVTADQVRVGMVLGKRSSLSPDTPTLRVVIAIDRSNVTLLRPEQARRFTRADIDAGKLNDLGETANYYGLGIASNDHDGMWSFIFYCTDETPDDPTKVFASE